MLVDRAKDAHDQMLSQVREDTRTTINSSKMINWIVADYFEHFFSRRKKNLCQAHFNSRKYVLDAMKNGDPEELRRALKEAARSLNSFKTKKKKDPDATKNSE